MLKIDQPGDAASMFFVHGVLGAPASRPKWAGLQGVLRITFDFLAAAWLAAG